MSTTSINPFVVAKPASDALAGHKARLEQLKNRKPKPGEASFYFYEAQFKTNAVKILPGEYFVFNEDLMLTTTLGSCIAVCLWDRVAKVGGMNHFLLPEGSNGQENSGRYGSFAMELLINELLKMGAKRSTLDAKVFGGGAVLAGMSSINVGERNTHFVLDYLKTERIPVISKDVMDIFPRKVCFFPHSGKAMVKRLAPNNNTAMAALEKSAMEKVKPTVNMGGSVDLF